MIPANLRNLRQWVIWRYEERVDGDGTVKLTKAPCRADDPRSHASSTDPSTWSSYERAAAAGAENVGFVFTGEDEFCGLDFDDCIDEDGEIAPSVRELVAQLDSYAEISPSGRGLKVIVRGRLPGRGRATSNTPWGSKFEVYDRARYFALTGRQVPGTPDEVNARQDALDGVYAQLLPERSAPLAVGRGFPGSDDELLGAAQTASNGVTFTRLWRGDWSAYGTQSEADLGLCSMLAFWTGPDSGRIDALFRRSDLMRPKWTEQHGAATYGQMTVGKALEGRTEFYELGARRDTADGGEDESKESVASRIVRYVLEAEPELFHDDQQEPYATVEVGEHRETWPVRSKSFKLYADRAFYLREDASANANSLADALRTLAGRAIYEGVERAVHFRVADGPGEILLDLGDERWRCVKINAEGWQVLDEHPVKFRRTPTMRALPDPERGGSVGALAAFLNVDDDGYVLYVGWLLGTLRPGYPFPVLVAHGEQGSGKSTLGRLARLLVDPSKVPLKSSPKTDVDLLVSATASWIVTADNVSSLTPAMSDALCRLSTGGGLSKRQLYTDGDEFVLDAMRPCVLNGIEEAAKRSDLLDRAVLIECPVIGDDRRIAEDEFYADFELVRAKLLGALLDAVAHALAHVDEVKLDRLPRMADFAKWVTAAEPALGWRPGTFMDAYQRNRAETHEIAVESDVIGPALQAVAADGFEGTSSELLEQVALKAGERAAKGKDWPRSPRALTGEIKRLAPNLRQLGVEVEQWRTKQARMIRLEVSSGSVTQKASLRHPSGETVTQETQKASPSTAPIEGEA